MIRRVVCLLSLVACVSGGSRLMDSSGNLRLRIPDIAASKGVVAVIASPGTTSLLSSSEDVLSLEDASKNPYLSCKGATLSSATTSERNSLATTSLVADAVLVDGVTLGDIEAGWKSSRHARTLALLFRARVLSESSSKQTMIICVKGEVDSSIENSIKSEVADLFDATAEEKAKGDLSLSDLYDVQVVSITTAGEAKEVRDYMCFESFKNLTSW